MTTFEDADLRGARFIRSDLRGAVLRGVDLDGADIDSPWLSALLVNGVDVMPLVEAELNRRFPGRERRRAGDPDGLRAAWAELEVAWSAALDRAAGLPAGAVDVQVDGEWSFAQTLRHLVMATDVWLRGAVLGVEQPYHPVGVPYAEFAADGYDTSVFTEPDPTYDRVLEVRAQHLDLVREYLAAVTADDLTATRPHPWAPERRVSVLACLHTVLKEEWEHLRYALRDLAALSDRAG